MSSLSIIIRVTALEKQTSSNLKHQTVLKCESVIYIPKPKIVFENFQSALFKSRGPHLFFCDYIDLSVAAAKMASGASGATTKATAAVSATSGSGGPYSALCGQNGMRAAGT